MIDPPLDESQGATSVRQLRQFAWIWLVFFGALTWFKGIRLHHDALACTFGVLAVAVWLAGLLRPKSILPLFAVLMAAAKPIGWLLSHLILGLMFYAIFVPLGRYFRLLGRDPLSLKRPPDDQTLWEPMPSRDDARGYYHQY